MFTKYKNIICEKYYFANIKYHKGDVKEMYRKHLKRNKQNKMDYTRGITLVALVITIVILIILATVTVNVALGDGGLIDQAKLAAEKTANSIYDEEASLANLTAYLNEQLGGVQNPNTNEIEDPNPPEEPFEPVPTPEPEGGGTAMSNMKNGVIEIKWLEGNTNKVASEPNPPAIKTSGLPEGTTMEQVVFDEASQEWIPGTEYSYVPGTGSNDNNASEWANARVTQQINGENVESYFVWIPRYAYRIIYFDSAESKKAYQEGTLTEEEAKGNGKIIGYSDSRGIVDAQGKKIESVTSESNSPKTMVSEDYFMTHPAFMDGTSTGFENGEWNEELTGIWIGKYEASSVEGNSDSTADNITTKHVKVQPGVSSWRYIQIGNCYTVSKNYAPELKSHMLKNSEWGVIVYLTESKYGRNGTEIGFSDQGYITGGGEGNAYIENNQNQSTTGNVYGIYDMRGGAAEYVASYYNGSDANTTRIGYGDPFASIGGTSDEYSTVYNSSGSGPSSASANYKYGDATYETSVWHGDSASFVYSYVPFFPRGGSCSNNASGAGVFYFGSGIRQRPSATAVAPAHSVLA